ncbi:MAG: hypothetical protein H0V81_13315 [Solirubrobacterales bacterium]|nr:hypothetical protein [Solirubrobacterales bacterium]
MPIRRALVLSVLASLTGPAGAAAATSSLPPRDAGPPILHRAAPKVPELQNRKPFRADPLLVSGTDAFRAGEYVFQDHLVDDRGADTVPLGNAAKTDKPDPTSTGDIAASTGGDVRYPTDPRYAGNNADIAEVRLRPAENGRSVLVRVTFRTAIVPDATVFTLGIDTDRAGSAPVAWPRGAGVSSPGLDQIATVWGTGGELTATTGGTTKLEGVTFDLPSNQLTFRLPLAPSAWRIVGGAGLWDGDSYLPVPAAGAPTATAPASGTPTRDAPGVLDLAFSFAEPIEKAPTGEFTTFPGTGNWLDERQAKALGTGTSGTAFADVDLRSATRARWLHAPGRLQARVLGSGLDVHEGVRTTFPEIGSRLVPYLLVKPDDIGTTDRPAALTFALHSFGGTYLQHAVFSPNLLTQLGDERGSVVVTPSSRSLAGGYATEAEADAFEVWADVARHVRLDPTRTAINGYSMGGFGAYRLAAAYPDLFAKAFTGVGPAGSSLPGSEQNVRWVPFLNWVAAADELVTYDRARAAQSRMVAAGMRSQLWTFAGEHFTLAILDEWGEAARFLGDARVTRDPWRVSYLFDPKDDRADLGLARNGAYWVEGLDARDSTKPASVDARSLASGERNAPLRTVTGTSVGVGGFPHGVRTGAGVPLPPLAIEGQDWGQAPGVAPERVLEVDLSGASTVLVNLRRAGFTGRAPVTVRMKTDGPAVLRTTDGDRCPATGAGTTVCRVRPDTNAG